MLFNLKRLKAERIAKGMTQSQLATAIGISRGSYAKKENGLSHINVNEFAKMICALGYQKKDIPIFFAEIVPERERNRKEIKK